MIVTQSMSRNILDDSNLSSHLPTINKIDTSNKMRTDNKKKITNIPVFLRKTYTMIQTSDPDIASWSEDGTTIVLKDTTKFASEIIPQFFKHNNLSSFVRQLNFYKFRKVKLDHIKGEVSDEYDVESTYWRFRHEKFLRDRPDLLSEIRKSNHIESPDTQQVEALKAENKDLKEQVKDLKAHIRKLTYESKDAIETADLPENSLYGMIKKRKLEHEPTNIPVAVSPELRPERTPSSVPPIEEEVSQQNVILVTSKPLVDLTDPPKASDADLLMEEYSPQDTQDSGDSNYSPVTLTTSSDDDDVIIDDEDIVKIVDLLDEESERPSDPSTYSPLQTAETLPGACFDASVVEDFGNQAILPMLQGALELLPREMQEQFIERMNNDIANYFTPPSSSGNDKILPSANAA